MATPTELETIVDNMEISREEKLMMLGMRKILVHEEEAGSLIAMHRVREGREVRWNAFLVVPGEPRERQAAAGNIFHLARCLFGEATEWFK